MDTVLITGANGFVGSYLSRLLPDDYKVVATGKGACRLDINHKNFQYESLDFNDEKEVSAVFSAYKPHVIVHAGALSKPDECELDKGTAYRTNVTATKNLLKEAKRLRSFFVYLSTDFIFSGEEKGMYSEEDPAAPVNYYGHTKLEAEAAVKQYPFDWGIVRTVLVYGKPHGGRDNILSMVAKNLAAGKPLRIFNDQVRTPTYVEDLTQGIRTILQKKATGVFHLSGEDVKTPYQMALDVAHYLGHDSTLIEKVTEQTFSQPASRPLRTGFNVSKAKRLLDYRTTPFSEGLKKTFSQISDLC